MTLFENKWIYTFILLSSVCLLIFVGINAMPIILWDESRNAINAYEMYANGWSLKTTFLNEGTDNWNTKPPLLIYLQVALMHIIGVNEWAIRIPSAFAGIITCCTVANWVKKETLSPLTALLSAIILATTAGFNGVHVLRTGDYDALLVMWTVAAAYHYFYFLQKKSLYHILLFSLCLSAAVLTKSVMGAFILPALGIYTILNRQLLAILKDYKIYLAGIIFLSIVITYYLLREYSQPGYLNIVYENELGGRFNKSLEVVNHPFLFYFEHIKMPYWIIFLFLNIIFIKRIFIKYRNLALFSFLIIFCHLLIISSAATKHTWYDALIYPFISIVLALALQECYIFFQNKSIIFKKIHFFTFIGLLVIAPIYMTITNNLNPSANNSQDQQVSLYLKKILEGEIKVSSNNIFCINTDYAPQNIFYTISTKNPAISIKMIQENHVLPLQHIVTRYPKVVEKLESKYDIQILEKKDGLIHFYVNGEKNNL